MIRLSDCWEKILHHGLKITIFKVTANFWEIASEHLTRHERERFNTLRHVSTDRGRFRALLRAALNEHSLERYVLMWVHDQILPDKYESYACMMCSSVRETLPQLAKSLTNILFALTVDASDLNENRKLNVVERVEPIIPAPDPVTVSKHKRTRAVERAIIERKNFGQQRVIEAPNIVPISVSPRESAPITVAPEEIINEVEVNGHYDRDHEENLIFELECTNLEDAGTNNTDEITDFVRHDNTEVSSNNTSDLFGKSTATSSSKSSSVRSSLGDSMNFNIETYDIELLKTKLKEKEDRCAELEKQVAELSLENCRLRMMSNVSRNNKIFFSTSILRAFLEHGSSTKKFYTYEINVTPANDVGETWKVKRRYREFASLHKGLKRNNPLVGTLDFPPKKKWNNLDVELVEHRRQRLNVYLKHLITILPDVSECCTRSELIETFPFLNPDVKYS